MKETLQWSDLTKSGDVCRANAIVELEIKPALTFEYDSIAWDREKNIAQKIVNRVAYTLTSIEKHRVTQFLNFFQFPPSYQFITGVDAAGQYLGQVPASEAYMQVFDHPPSMEFWRYDFSAARFVYVHGVDANGVYVGNVPLGECSDYAHEPPSLPYERWDSRSKRWVDARQTEEFKSELMRFIAQNIEALRKRYRSDIFDQGNIYKMKYEEALGFQLDNTGVYPLLESEAAVRQVSVRDLAQAVINKEAVYKQAMVQAEGVRMKWALKVRDEVSVNLASFKTMLSDFSDELATTVPVS